MGSGSLQRFARVDDVIGLRLRLGFVLRSVDARAVKGGRVGMVVAVVAMEEMLC